MAEKGAVDRDSWKRILGSVVAIFDDLKSRGTGQPEVVLGGGTVLMFRFEHRLSKDINLFLHDAQRLTLLTPRLNDFVAALTQTYEEQANSVKLVLPGGDIDFIVSGTVTDDEPIETMDFGGYRFALETTAEILAKKLFYRAESFKLRDVFDLAVATDMDKSAATRAVAAAAAKRDVLERRLEHLSHLSPDEAARDILPIGDFSRTLATMVNTVRRFVRDDSKP